MVTLHSFISLFISGYCVISHLMRGPGIKKAFKLVHSLLFTRRLVSENTGDSFKINRLIGIKDEM